VHCGEHAAPSLKVVPKISAKERLKFPGALTYFCVKFDQVVGKGKKRKKETEKNVGDEFRRASDVVKKHGGLARHEQI
jgi:hypothetical protein